MIRGMGEYFTEWARKYMPDPFLFAILLTFLTFVLGLIFTKNGPFSMILHWYKGFWTLLTFAMQMCLILVTGYALATAPAVKRGLDALARVPKTPSGAVYLIVVVVIIAGYINWGLGLIVGAIFAKEVARQGYLRKIPLHYPLMGAAGDIGLAVSSGGDFGAFFTERNRDHPSCANPFQPPEYRAFHRDDYLSSHSGQVSDAEGRRCHHPD
jgi:short-chain fatty acids transporter